MTARTARRSVKTMAAGAALAATLLAAGVALADVAQAAPAPRIPVADFDKPVAIIASGDQAHLVDSVTAGPLASTVAGNVLLVPQDRMVADTYAYLSDAHVQVAFIVGGTTAVGPVPEQRIRSYGITVYRLAGADRYETARLIADVNDQALDHFTS